MSDSERILKNVQLFLEAFFFDTVANTISKSSLKEKSFSCDCLKRK